MKVKLKFGHHNGKRFHQAGEVMECSENLGQSLIRQGLAVLYVEKKKEPEQPSGNAGISDAPAESGSNGTGETPAAGDTAAGEETEENEKAQQGENPPQNTAQAGAGEKAN